MFVATILRICFEKIQDDEKKSLLRQYFKRRAIYFRYLSITQDQIFFKPIKKHVQPKYDSNKPLPLEDFIKTVKTVKFLDRTTFSCKVCDYYNENKDIVVKHVTRFHIQSKKTLSEKEIFAKYVKCS